MKFTQLIEKYNDTGLKSLSSLFEEPDNEQFTKEVEAAKEKNSGKIKNKQIAEPLTVSVKDVKEDVDEEQLKEYEIVKGADGYYHDDEGNRISSLNPQQKSQYKKAIWNKPRKRNFSAKDMLDAEKKDNELKKEDADLEERALTSDESGKKEKIVKALKKNSDFKKRYGKDFKDVMYATATSRAKE
jgi:hypothetical protein